MGTTNANDPRPTTNDRRAILKRCSCRKRRFRISSATTESRPPCRRPSGWSGSPTSCPSTRAPLHRPYSRHRLQGHGGAGGAPAQGRHGAGAARGGAPYRQPGHPRGFSEKGLSGEAGVRQALVVAGDNSDPQAGTWHPAACRFWNPACSSSTSIKKTVGVAGHPEGHRAVGDPVLRDALRRKNAYKQQTGANVYLVTQFAFTANPVLAWEASHGTDIGSLPVVVGLPRISQPPPRKNAAEVLQWLSGRSACTSPRHLEAVAPA